MNNFCNIFLLKRGNKFLFPFVFLMIFSSSFCLYAQTNLSQSVDTTKKVIDIYNADMLVGLTINGKAVQKLIGKVVLHHQGALMFCDSAIIDDATNSAQAYGHIHIKQGDTLDLYGDEMNYNGNEKIVNIKKRVRLIDKEIDMNTDEIIFDRNAGMIYYADSANIKTQKDNLTSDKGYYYINRKEFAYKGNVILKNPEYDLYTDTMIYNTVKDITYFYGPTEIISKDSYIYCENGFYDKKRDRCQFNKNAFVKAENSILRGDSLYYERRKGYGKGIGNVSIIDTVEKFTVMGQFAETYKNIERYMITDSMQLIQRFDDGDSLFLHADTLLAIQDSSNKRVLNAYYKVKFYKSDMQGACDSLVYHQADSLIRMYHQPVLWTDNNQITGEEIHINIGKSQIYYFNILRDALIVQKEDKEKYNQIAGKNMMGYFKENDLVKVDVKENSKTIYFPKEENGDYIGMNEAISENIQIYLNNNEIIKIVFLKKPKGTLHPLSKIKPDAYRLDGFSWQENRRPKNRWEIFN